MHLLDMTVYCAKTAELTEKHLGCGINSHVLCGGPNPSTKGAFGGHMIVNNRQTDNTNTQTDWTTCVTPGHILCYALQCGIII